MLSFPPLSFSYFVFFAFIPLFILERTLQSQISFRLWTGGIFLFFSFYVLTGFIPYYSLFLYFFSSIVLAVFLFAPFFFYPILKKRIKGSVSRAFVLGSIAVLTVFIQNHSFLVFPGGIFLPIAKISFFLGVNKLFGVYFLVFALYFINDLLYSFFFLKEKKSLVFCFSFIFLWIGLSLVSNWHYQKDKTLKYSAAVLQGSIPVKEFRKEAEKAESLKDEKLLKDFWEDLDRESLRIMDVYSELVSDVRGKPFIIIPEAVFPYSYSLIESYFYEKSYIKEAPIISGINKDEGNQVYNAIVFLDAYKNSRFFYKKQSLVPFVESGKYASGKDYLRPIEFESLKWGPAICLENVRPGHFKELRKQGVDVFLVVTDDAGFKKTPLAEIHSWFSILRAAENNAYLIHAAQSGPTFIVDQNGKTSESSALFEKKVYYGDFYPVQKLSFYAQIDDIWIILFILFLNLGGWLYFKKIKIRKNNEIN
ncbi:MAG: hypothetical protein A2Y41_00940 [Spirochaetes bacterium GWB1_36_13]|nr:MAG: hypothetical protein A2Y41_00940 [Spirochaetes bacterium GWB1_36_13]